ncbi:MAG: DNA repair protein RadC [Gammaproteobacteria bacterium]|nr:DNA repair protein RadC [Gammaproteobacteria bacterium]
MPISDWPPGERPQDKFARHGADALSDAELLAMLIRTGVRGRSALRIAQGLLSHFGGLRALLHAERTDLPPCCGVGPARFAQLKAVVEIGRRQLREQMTRGNPLENPRATRDYLRARLRDVPHELFCCLLMDNRHRVISFTELFRGTIDGASVHPREVLKHALKANAAAVILAHNHPSGVAEPSRADELITRRLRDALSLVDIRLLDHFVVGETCCVSLAERGLI